MYTVRLLLSIYYNRFDYWPRPAIPFWLNAVEGIEPNEQRIHENLYNSLMLVTALNPHIGYDKAAEVAKKAYTENLSLREAIVELGYMGAEEFDKLVQPEKMIRPSKIEK